MLFDANAVSQAIKKAGSKNVRVVPMAGQSVNEGMHNIEISSNGNWEVVASGVAKLIAEQIVSQALNRVICG